MKIINYIWQNIENLVSPTAFRPSFLDILRERTGKQRAMYSFRRKKN